MRQIRNVLRHYLEGGLTLRDCARAVGMPKSTTSDIVRAARIAAVDWTTAQTLTDAQLEARLYPQPRGRVGPHTEPDYAHADAILDRLVHTAQRIELKGPSQRKPESSAA